LFDKTVPDLYKRLDRGRFQLPQPAHGDVRHVESDDASLVALLDGIDIEQAVTTRPRLKTH